MLAHQQALLAHPICGFVLAVGLESENQLVGAVEGLAPQVHATGDCVQPQDIFGVIHEAGRFSSQNLASSVVSETG